MAFTKYQTILALILVIGGTFNTISVKWMDEISAKGRDGETRKFVHPFLQADFMFIGEMLCYIAFIIILKKLRARKDDSENTSPLTKGSRNFNKFMLIPPAVMDIAGTSLMYFGLSLTNAASFQMLRGSVIVFVALLSWFVLKQKLKIREWIGIILIIVALILVGLSDFSQTHKADEKGPVKDCKPGGAKPGVTSAPGAPAPEVQPAPAPTDAPQEDNPQNNEEEEEESQNDEVTDEEMMQNDETADIKEDDCKTNSTSKSTKPKKNAGNNALLGDVLIVFAQLITASQMVYEEVFVEKLEIAPLQMVGLEGIFGLSILSLILIPLNFIPNINALKDVNAGGTLEDPIDGLVKIGNNALLLVPILGMILSIAFFNFAGISLTKEINATTRMVLDSIRILTVWLFSLAVGWQDFHWLQILGFLFLITGMCIYNNIVVDKIIAKVKSLKK